MTPIKLTLPGSIRSKKNSKRIIRCGKFTRIVPSKAYVQWEKIARSAAWEYSIIPPLTCPVSVEAHFYFKGPQPDLSGCCESIGDCLEGIIWANDGLIESWDGSRLHHDLKDPRTEIIIRPMPS